MGARIRRIQRWKKRHRVSLQESPDRRPLLQQSRPIFGLPVVATTPRTALSLSVHSRFFLRWRVAQVPRGSWSPIAWNTGPRCRPSAAPILHVAIAIPIQICFRFFSADAPLMPATMSPAPPSLISPSRPFRPCVVVLMPVHPLPGGSGNRLQHPSPAVLHRQGNHLRLHGPAPR